MLNIQSNRLQVEITQPHVAPSTTSRFDRAGAVTEIILDGTHRFCATEPNNLPHPSTGGRGLMNAYRLDVSRETPVGARYPRLGVGLLYQAESGPYSWERPYDIQPYPVHWTITGDAVTFVTEPIPCQGYAVRQEKRIQVTDNVLSMAVKLTNTGEKPLHTQEYCHNFLTIDGMAIGPGYTLALPAANHRGKLLTDVLMGAETGYTFTGFSPRDGYLLLEPFQFQNENPFVWQLKSTDAKASITGTDHFTPSQVALWYADHMICVEVDFGIHLAPGERIEWLRTWQFDAW